MSETQKHEPSIESNKEAKETIYKSHSNAPHVIADAFNALNTLIDGDKTFWEMPNTPKGQALEAEMDRLKSEIPNISDLLKSKAQRGGVNEINKFLKENGFTIQLDPIGSNDLAAASVLNMPVKWKFEGRKDKIILRDSKGKIPENSKTVDSVHMDIEDIYVIPGHENPIIKIPTQGGEYVCMTRYNEPPSGGSVAINKIAEQFNSQLTKNNKKTVGEGKDYSSSVEFPMVNYDKSGNLTDVLGAQTVDESGNILEIDQAKYQHILKMNEKGATAKAAVALSTRKGMLFTEHANIDGPFIIWFERDGIIPFSAYISQNDMEEPENLD